MSYFGGKGGPGVWHTLINLMPPHQVYVEPFVGAGGVMRHKLPARLNIGIDMDPRVIARWKASSAGLADAAGRIGEDGAPRQHPYNFEGAARPAAPDLPILATRAETAAVRSRFHFRVGDGIGFLATYPFTGEELVYCDPPYVLSTRRSARSRYAYEMTDDHHGQLLEVVKALPCRVMVSGYWSKLYAEQLGDWTSVKYQAMTRGGRPATEFVWFNFERPVELHDCRYLGGNFRERQNVKRKQQRWADRLRRMDPAERMALLSAIAATGIDADSTRSNLELDALELAMGPGR